jgi:hypothetical protein
MDAPSVGGSGLSDEVDEESPIATATEPLVHASAFQSGLSSSFHNLCDLKADPPLLSYLQVSPQLARGGCHLFPFLFIVFYLFIYFAFIYLFTFYLYFQSSRRKPTMTRRWRW